MARKGTAAWLPGQPKAAPAEEARVPASTAAGARASQPRVTLALGDRAGGGRRATRPFRFGSENRADPDPPLEPGVVVGERYRIVGLLGEGGMGRVYEAEHTVLRRRVALKLLRREAQASPENLARFQQEALAASRIGTPEIVEIADFASHVGPFGRQTYMIMELLEGESLEAWMDQPARLDVGVELLASLCDGLAAAHRAGVIHRDIKPANVFCRRPDPTLGERGPAQIKILDFGIAKITAGDQGFVTQQGSLLGTPYYLAPERALGAKLSPAADLYSVGVILYEMLTGNVPFVADSFMGILAQHAHTLALDPRQAAPDRPIPDAIASICMGLLAKEPGARPTAEALATALRELLARSRPALAAVATGPRGGVAGPGDDTQVLREDAGESVSSTTLPPAVELSAVRPRSRTAIGHRSAAASASTLSVGAASPPREPEATGRGVGLAIGLGVILALGLGSLVFMSTRGGPASSDAAPSVDEPASDPAPAVAETPSDELGASVDGSAPTEDGASVDGSAPSELGASVDASASPDVESGAAPDPAHSDDPIEPTPEPKAKTGAQSKAEPEPKPPPAQPEEPATQPDSAPPDPDPGPKPDPGLPTIKDDVYD